MSRIYFQFLLMNRFSSIVKEIKEKVSSKIVVVLEDGDDRTAPEVIIHFYTICIAF